MASEFADRMFAEAEKLQDEKKGLFERIAANRRILRDLVLAKEVNAKDVEEIYPTKKQGETKQGNAKQGS